MSNYYRGVYLILINLIFIFWKIVWKSQFIEILDAIVKYGNCIHFDSIETITIFLYDTKNIFNTISINSHF